MAQISPEADFAALGKVLSYLAVKKGRTPDQIRSDILSAGKEYKDLLLAPLDAPTRQLVAQAIDDHDVDSFLFHLEPSVISSLIIPRRPGQILSRRTKEVLSLLGLDGQRKKVVGAIPEAVRVGKDAHNKLEALAKAKGNLPGALGHEVTLVVNGSGQVSAVDFGIVGEETVQLEKPLWAGMESQNGVVETRKLARTLLSKPVPGPADGENLVSWGVRNLGQAYEELAGETLGIFPVTPYEIVEMQSDDKKAAALKKINELTQILLPNADLARVIVPIRGGGGYQFKELPPLEFLNSLSVARKILEATENKPEDGELGVLTELSLGTIRVDGMEIGCGFADTLRVRLPKPKDKILVTEEAARLSGLSFSDMVSVYEGKTGSRARRHYRLNVAGPDESYERHHLPGNFDALNEEMVKLFGLRYLREATFQIEDFKFIGGDGGLNSYLDVNKIPAREDQVQINDYMFAMAAHLLLAERRFLWSQKFTEDDPLGSKTGFSMKLDSNEVINYILETKLYERLSSKLSYQLPAGTKEVRLTIPSDREELELWTGAVLDRKSNTEEKLPRIRVLATIEKVLKPRSDTVEISRRGVSPVPEHLSQICGEFLNKHYLSIQDLYQLLMGITDPVDRPPVRVSSAAHFGKENISVMWLAGLSEQLCRLSINRSNGQFQIAEIKVVSRPVMNGNSTPEGFLDVYEVDNSKPVISGMVAVTKGRFGLVARSEVKEALQDFNKYVWESFFRMEGISPVVLRSAEENWLNAAGQPWSDYFNGKRLGMHTNPMSGEVEFFVIENLPESSYQDFLKRIGRGEAPD